MRRDRLIVKTGFWPEFFKIGFLLLIGMILGGFIINYYDSTVIDNQLRTAVFYKAMEIDGRQYSLKELP